MEKVDSIVKDGLCCSCGVCIANCPKQCIQMIRDGYEYYPSINLDSCIDCGICSQICSKGQMTAYKGDISIEDYLLGEYKGIYAAQVKNEEILTCATSGGVITGIIKKLLREEQYDSAFLVEGYNYDERLVTKRFIAHQDLLNTTKSRYLTVSHEEAVNYMRQNASERIILVATGCAIQAIINSIEKWGLKRDNYLLIGLFCDKTMHYGVLEYFKEHPMGNGRIVKDLFFRTKQAGGWPGNVRLVYSDGSLLDRPKTDRIKVKDYFVPERCLYCLDKLNRNADIAVGDNYVKDNADVKGISSVIIRTTQGEKAWLDCESDFVIKHENNDSIKKSQKLSEKKNNFYFAILKGLYKDSVIKIPNEVEREYKNALEQMEIGKSESVYNAIQSDIKKRTFKRRIYKVVKLIKSIGK